MHLITRSRNRPLDQKFKEVDEAAGDRDNRGSTQAAAAWAWFQHGGATTARPEQSPQTISKFNSTGAAASVTRPSRFKVEAQNKSLSIESILSKSEHQGPSSSRRHSISSSSSFSGNLQLQQLREEILQMSYNRSSSAKDANVASTSAPDVQTHSSTNTHDESKVTMSSRVNDRDGITSPNDDSMALVELVDEHNDNSLDEDIYDLMNLNYGAPSSAVALFDSFDLEDVSRRLANAMAAAKEDELDEDRGASTNYRKPVGRALTRRRSLNNMISGSNGITQVHRQAAVPVSNTYINNPSSNKAQLSGPLQQLLRFRIPSPAICDSVATVDSTFYGTMGRKKMKQRSQRSHVTAAAAAAAKADHRPQHAHTIKLQQLQVLNKSSGRDSGERGIVAVNRIAPTTTGHISTHFHHHFHHHYLVNTHKVSK